MCKSSYILDHKAGLNKCPRLMSYNVFSQKSATKTVIIKRDKKPLYVLEFLKAYYKKFMGAIRQEEIKA